MSGHRAGLEGVSPTTRGAFPDSNYGGCRNAFLVTAAEEPRGFANDGSGVSPIIITSWQARSGRSVALNGPFVSSASVCGLF